MRKADSISEDSTHPGHSLFEVIWQMVLNTKNKNSGRVFIPEQWLPTHDTTDCVHAIETFKLQYKCIQYGTKDTLHG